MFLAFGPNFEFGNPPKVPDSFKATCHIFYRTHVVELNDNLPKYEGHKEKSNLIDLEKEATLPPVLLLGDQRLRTVSTPVTDYSDQTFATQKALLKSKLEQFRRENGFGRAISAPQIGILKRFIAMKIDQRPPFCIINPIITSKSESKFTMWDDCMSFPWLMIKVERHTSIDIDYIDESGQEIHWKNIDQPTSELLQHEIDHLNGVLAVDLALDKDSIVSRKESVFPTMVSESPYHMSPEGC